MSITFDVGVFRSQVPAYADSGKYPDTTLQVFFDTATCYVSDCDSGRLTGDCRLRALNFMVAHLVFISDMAQAGETPGYVTQSKVGEVLVSLQPPPQTDQWQWWLNLSPYGQQLSALLSVSAIGGFYVGGSRERSAIRKVRGRF